MRVIFNHHDLLITPVYKALLRNIEEHQLPILKFNRRNPLWQANYYDHIIRDGQAHERIAEYIRRNPVKWEQRNIELHENKTR